MKHEDLCMFVHRRSLRYFDWIAFFLIVTLMSIGLLFIYSATYKTGQPFSLFFKKQASGIAAAIVIYLVCSLIDYRWFMQWSGVFYTSGIALLLFTIIKGSIGMGAQRWVNLVFIKIQPSELIKLFFPLWAASYLYDNRTYFSYSLREFAPLFASLCISFLLILKQPDLGTALIVLFSGIILFWLSGINKKYFIYAGICIAVSAPFSWHTLRPYQKKRVLVFLGQGDAANERYHIEQSKIAIGSGGTHGKGFLQGTQNKLLFLPESRTDFIFSVICEEAGFLGALLILALYTLLFLHLLGAAISIEQEHIQLLSFGLIIPLVLATIINIGMVLGLLPIVGIPLPFISYGLSNLWVTCASLGIFNTIVMHHTHTIS